MVPPTPPSDNNNEVSESDDDGDSPKKAMSAGGLSLMKMLDAYTGLLEKHTAATKGISAAILMGLGDVIMQAWEMKKNGSKFDWKRFVVFTTVAVIYFAPVIHCWFNFLASLPLPANKFARASMMIVIDQTLGAVVVTTGFFYVLEAVQRMIPPFISTPEGKNVLQAIAEGGTASTKNSLKTVLVANWKYWPVVNFLNFLYVPLQFQLLISNVASVFWNIYLSGATSS